MKKGKGKKQIKKTKSAELNFGENFRNQIIVVLVLVAILYGNTLFNGYSLDDHLVTLNNNVIAEGFQGIPKILTSRYSENEGNVTYGYRPIVQITFAIEHRLWGSNAFLSHFINLLLYGLSCLLLFLILRRLFKEYNRYLPFFATLLFAAHPIHTEVVASLKNRDEILCLAFALGTIWAFLKFADTNKFSFVIVGLLSFLLSFLSKPTSIPYIALVPLILYFFTDIKFYKLAIIALGLLAIVLIANYGPQYYLPPLRRPRRFFENNIRFEDFWTRLTTGSYILLFYLKKLFIPFPLLYYYGYNMIPILKLPDIRVIFSFLFHGSIFVYAILKLKQKSIWSFIILFYLISIVMFTNVVRPVMGIVAERFLLTPSIAFSVFLVLVAFLIFKAKINQAYIPVKQLTNIIIFITLILLPFSALTINRNTAWKDQYTLFKADMPYLENSVKANDLYAKEISNKLETGNYKPSEKQELVNEAFKHYKQVLTLYPDYEVAWNNLATIYSFFLGNNEEAIKCLKKAIEIRPKEDTYYFNLSLLYDMNLKDKKRALKYMKDAYALDPESKDNMNNLARLYAENKFFDSANLINEKLLQLDSLSDIPHINSGNYAIIQGDTINAVRHWEKAVELNPANDQISLWLSRHFNTLGDRTKSSYYQKLANQAKSNKK
ncbi:MAG: tetratricopeptide repeat protein [Bacteroidales bacterium]